jgi:hypothetical protein
MANQVTTQLTVEGLGSADAVLSKYGLLEDALKHLTTEERKALAETLIMAEALDKLEAGADSAAEAIDKWANRIVALVAAYVSFNAVKHFLTDAVGDAMKADDVWQTLHATLEVNDRDADKLGKTLQALGKETERLTRYTGDQVLAAGNVLSVYKNISNDALPRVIELVKDISRQKGLHELTSQATQLGRALENPAQAMRMLKTAGITLSEAVEDQVKVFMEAGEVAKAQEVILDELEAKYTGLADTLGTTVSDRFEIVQHRFEDMRKGIGDDLLPIVERSIPLFEALAVAIEQSLQGFDVGPLDEWNDTLTQTERNIISLTIALTNMGDIFTLNSANITKGLAEWALGFQQFMDKVTGNKGGGGLLSQEFVKTLIEDQERVIDQIGNRLGDQQTKAEDRLKNDREAAAKRKKEREAEREQAKQDRDFRRGAGGMLDEFNALMEFHPEAAKKKADKDAERRERDIAARTERERVAELMAVGMAGDRAAGGRGKRGEDAKFQASMEGLTDLYRRISTAAATDTPEAKIEKAVREEGKKEVEKLEKIERELGPLKDIPPLLKEAISDRGLA